MKIDRKNMEKCRIAVIQAITDIKSEFPEDPSASRFINTLLQTAFNTGGDVNCEEFVKSYCLANRIAIRPNGIFKNEKIVKNPRAFFHRMHENWEDYKKTHQIKKTISRESIALEFEAILEEKWDKKRDKIQSVLQPVSDFKKFDELVTKWVTLVAGHEYPPGTLKFRLCKGFLAHFIWQTMSKLHSGAKSILEGGNEAMLLLVSTKQKTGKSTAVRLLLEIFMDEGFVWRTSFDRLEDKFSLQNLAYNYIAWFDDASRGKISNMGKFKQLVTDDEVSFRAIYTQTEMRLPKMATLIGTSNLHARELVNDTTGMRRFHEIAVNNGSVHDGTGINLDELRKFDYEMLYRTCPMGVHSPMFNMITELELTKYEEEHRPRHVIELWIDSMKYTPSPVGDVHPAKDMYDNFRIWASNKGYSGKYIPVYQSFGNKLEELGFQRGRTNKHRGFIVEREEEE